MSDIQIDVTDAVTPSGVWKKVHHRLEFVDDTLHASPAPIAESTSYGRELKVDKGEEMSSIGIDQSSFQLLNLSEENMSFTVKKQMVRNTDGRVKPANEFKSKIPLKLNTSIRNSSKSPDRNGTYCVKKSLSTTDPDRLESFANEISLAAYICPVDQDTTITNPSADYKTPRKTLENSHARYNIPTKTPVVMDETNCKSHDLIRFSANSMSEASGQGESAANDSSTKSIIGKNDETDGTSSLCHKADSTIHSTYSNRSAIRSPARSVFDCKDFLHTIYIPSESVTIFPGDIACKARIQEGFELCNSTSLVHDITTVEPSGHSSQRPVSPILPVVDHPGDDLGDTSSTSSSELSESYNPRYSKSYLHVLMSGDDKLILDAIRKKSETERLSGSDVELSADGAEKYLQGAAVVNSDSTINAERSESSRHGDSFFDVNPSAGHRRKLNNTSSSLSSTWAPKPDAYSLYDSGMFNGASFVSSVSSSPNSTSNKLSEDKNPSTYDYSLSTVLSKAVKSNLQAKDDTGVENSITDTDVTYLPNLPNLPNRVNDNSSDANSTGTYDSNEPLASSSRRDQLAELVTSKQPIHLADTLSSHRESLGNRKTLICSTLPAKGSRNLVSHELANVLRNVPTPPASADASQERNCSVRLLADNVSNNKVSNGDLGKSTKHIEFKEPEDISASNTVTERVADREILNRLPSPTYHRTNVDSPSEHSTQYLPIAASAMQVKENTAANNAVMAALPEIQVGRQPEEAINLHHSQTSPTEKLHVEDWLSNQYYEYVSESEPQTKHAEEDTTLLADNRSSTCNLASYLPQNVSCTSQLYNKAHNSSINTTNFITVNNMEESTLLLHQADTSQASGISKHREMRAIETPSSYIVPGVHPTLTNICADVPITNCTSEWLNVSMAVTEHRINGKLCATKLLFFRQGDNVLKPSTTDYIPVWMNSAVAGRHEVSVAISVEGGTTMQPTSIILAMEIERPDVQLVDNSDGILDFGVVPYGCIRKVPLTLANKSRVNISLVVKITPDADLRGRMEISDYPSTSASSAKDPVSMKLTLSRFQDFDDGYIQSLYVLYKAPLRHGKQGSPEKCLGRIAVYQTSAMSAEPLLVVRTQALCGYTDLQIPVKYHSFDMRCKPKSEVAHDIPIKNNGDVPADISLSLSNTAHFIVAPDNLHINPGCTKMCKVAFISSNIPCITSTVYCTLNATVEPAGNVFSIDLRGCVEKPSAIPPNISQLRQDALVPCPIGANKLKIKVTPFVIKFGGLDLSEKRVVTVKIQNCYDEPIKLIAEINKPDYQIAVMQSDTETLYSSREIVVPVSKSSTDYYPLRIIFHPRQVGCVESRLKCKSLEKGIKFRIPIYGYGGSSLIQPIVKEQRAPNHYSISAGDISNISYFEHQLLIRNVGYHKAFMTAKCYSRSCFSEELESSRISVGPSPLIIKPADVNSLKIKLKITDREKVLCEKSRAVVACIRIQYVDQILRNLLQRNVAREPERTVFEIAPFLQPVTDDESKPEISLPDEACTVKLFESHIKSFVIDIYAEKPDNRLETEPTRETLLASLTHKSLSSPQVGLEVTTRSLTFSAKVNEEEELAISIRNRSTSDVKIQISKLHAPFNCKTKNCVLRSKNRGTLRIKFMSKCAGSWEQTVTITSSSSAHSVLLIGKCFL